MNTLEMKIDALVRLSLCDNAEDKEIILKTLRDLTNGKQEVHTNYNKKVSEVLLELGIPDSILGHKYLAYIIPKVIKNPENYDVSVTKALYPDVAKHFHSTPSRVERAIRHAIEVHSDRCDYKTIFKYFGNTISPNKGKPTNSEFIYRLANVLREDT